jgi:hypothetical protein
MKLTLLISLLALSCNTAAVQQRIELSLTTSGGFSGRGLGSVAVHGNDLTAKTIGGAECARQLDAQEQQQLATAVASARAETWKEDYTPSSNPHGNADQIHYTLTLDGRSVRWTDEATPALPPALSELQRLASSLRNDACRK